MRTWIHLRGWCLAFTALTLVFLLAPRAFGQGVTSAGVTGVLLDASGAPVSGAVVTARHEPTGTTYTAVTRADGRFDFRAMIAGGPFTLSAESQGATARRGGIYTLLADVTSVSLVLGVSDTDEDIIRLEALQVVANATELDGAATGAGTLLSLQRLRQKPTSERSIADLVSSSSFVTLRSFGGDREEAQITALGQNNRYNSIQIDGARINDQFGLNATGLASFFNPLSLETVEQIAVQVSPYDVRQAGFTGASINAVTRSGTNDVRGSLYYYFQGDSWLGIALRGENAREKEVSGVDITPRLERETYGFTLGGPIVPNRLFFFTSYERFQSESAGRDPRLRTPQDAQILAQLNAFSQAAGRAINWGNLITAQTTNKAEDEKFLAKVDWNINQDHRLSMRYTITEGKVPQFGRYASGALNNYLGLSGGPVTSPDGHFYAQERVEESYAAQLFSQWTDRLKTEIRYARTTQDQDTPVNTVAPEIAIYGLSGTDLATGRPVTNGVFVAGTEQFRQGNQIRVKTEQFSASGDYLFDRFVLTGGFDREQSDFFNLFRQGSYGRIAFRTVADFLVDRPARIERNVYDPALRNPADISEFAETGVFTQVKWDLNPRLALTLGLRYNWYEQPIKPAFNQAFFSATGFRNDGTLDGSDYLSPRFGFNWAANEERTVQVRGGVGHFTGRTPWVFFSNSYNNLGVGSFTQITASPGPGAFTAYLRNQFDPANPIGTATDTGGRREVNWTDDGTTMPSTWRGNVGVDWRLDAIDSILTVEGVYSKIDEALFISNENLRPINAPAADGRRRFAGAVSNAANARFPGYLDLYRIRNVSGGSSFYATVTLERPMKDDWAYVLSYTRGSSKEAQAIGQTTASGQWERNVVFNQGDVEIGTSDFEIKDRVQAQISRRFEFIQRAPTTVTLYYEGRTGNPYSWVYTTDLNGDGRNDNDLVAVPSGPNDPRFDFSGLSAAQLQTYLGYFDAVGLSGFGGGVASKNSHNEPWVNRLDLKFVQEIPIYAPAKMELFFDFINFGAFISRDFFGFYEEAPQLSNDVFRRRNIGGASYGPDGRIRPTVQAPNNFVIDNGQSRWRVQLGARLLF